MAADLEQTQAIFFDEFDDETDDEDAASKGPVSHLRVLSTADFSEKVFPLHEGNNVIGRQEGVCDICIPLKGLSREHACIQIQGGSHLIYDKGSRNKTRRGKLFLSPDVRYELKHNDQLIFGDVSCVYLIENQKGDSGSETGSESMFQTAPSDALGTAQKQGALEGTMVIEEEGYESDESVDLLQPTQAYVSNSTATLKIAPDSDDDDDDDDEDVKKNHNITVKDTPAPTRLKDAGKGFNTIVVEPTEYRQRCLCKNSISTLVLPESDSETDDEEQKKLKSNDIQTLYIEETQKDDSADGDILYAATQACHVTESDDETDDEESNDLHKDILTAATQAFTDIDTKKDETEDSSDMPTQSFVAESDDEKDRTKNKLVVKEIEITDDESTDDEDGVGPDVSHLFANPTLACDMEDYNDEDDQNKRCGMDEPTQAFSGEDAPTQTFENVSQSSQQGQKEETLVIHEGETLAVEDVTTARKIPKADTVVTGDDATQVFGGDETVAIDESPVSKKALSPHIKSKDDDATQVFSGDEDQTMAITDSPVSKKVMSPHVKSKDDDATQVFSGDEDQTMAITESPVSKKGENTPKGLSPNLKSKDKDPTQVFSGVDDQTLAITESPVSNKQVMIQNKEPEVEDATLAISYISEDATMAVSDELLPTVKQNRRGRRNAKKPQTEPDDNIDATLDVNNITSDATVAISDDTPTENKTQQSKQMSRGRKSGRNVKSDTDNSITGDATVAVSEETQADSETETKRLKTSRRGKKKSVVSSNTVDASVVSSDTVDATVAITDDTMPASKIDVVQDKKGKKNVRKSHKKEADATQEFDLTSIVNSDDAKMTEGAGVGNNDATQVFEKSTGSPVKKDNIDETNSNVQFENVSNDDTQTFTGNATIPVSELDQAKPSPPRGRSSRNKVKEENKSTETAKTRKKQGKHQDKDTSNDATQGFDNDGATQVFDLDVTEDVAEDNKCKKGGKSKKSGGKLSSRTKDDVSEMPDETTTNVSSNVEATQVYAMEVDDDDATPVIEPTQPYCMEDDEMAAHINIEPTQPYCLEEEMAPQDEESVPDSEERNEVLRSPVVPLPPTSPHKSVLASPNRRQQKSPSPKRVKFDVKKGMSENSEEIGSEPSTSNVDTDRKISTRGTRGKVDTSVESTSKASKKGKKTETQEETTPALTKSTRGRRSAQAEIQKQDEEKITKKGRKSLPAESQKTEEEKTTRRGGRRSVPAVMERNTEENKVESSEVKTRGKRGKTKVMEDVDEKNEDKNVTENEAEKPSKTEKVETKPAKKARGKVSVETVSQNEKGDHVDLEDTSSETVRNNKDKDVHKEHQENESECKTEGKPTNKRTKGKRGKLKNISEETDKTDDEPAHVTDVGNSVNDKTEEETHPSTSTTEDEQVNTGRRKRGHTSAIHPTDNKNSEPTSSNSVVEDDKKQSEGRGRTRRGRDSAVKKDETSSKENDKSTQNKEEKSDSHPSVRSKGKRGRESEPVESVEVNVDNSVVEQSVIHKSGKRGKKSEHVESKNEQNDVPPDTLAKLKRTGKNKPGNSDVTINDDSVNDIQESDTKTRSKRRKVTENSEDSQESDTKTRSKRRKDTENSEDSQEVKSKAGGKRKTVDQDVTLVEESTSKNNRKRGKEIENDVTQSPSSRKPTNTLTVSSPSLRRKSVEPKPKVLFTGVVDEQGQRIVKELGGELVSSVYDCTHLVTDKVRRTLKFLCCLSRGIPIVKPTWLENCNQSKRFIDYTPYLVQDTAAEKQYNFSLRKSIEKASETSVLNGYKIHVTKSVKPDPPQMEDIIKCSGGEYLKTLPKKSSENTIVISCPDDKPMCEAALKADIPVVNAEFILTGILRQEADVNAYRIFTEGNSSRKRGADSLAGGPSKRRR